MPVLCTLFPLNFFQTYEKSFFRVTDKYSSWIKLSLFFCLEPPRFLEEPIHSRQAHIGCQISFLCNVTGWPKPSITWYKNGDLMVESNRVSFLVSMLFNVYIAVITRVGCIHFFNF